MLSSLILSLLIASPSYKVQNHNSAYERKTADQITSLQGAALSKEKNKKEDRSRLGRPNAY